jgi:hypothetical protein
MKINHTKDYHSPNSPLHLRLTIDALFPKTDLHLLVMDRGPYYNEVTFYTMSSDDSDIFTFLTVYYKYGDYSSKSFKTLRDGLHAFLNDYLDGTEHEVGIRRQQLEGLADEDLLTEILKLGEWDLIFYTICFSHLSCLWQALNGLPHNAAMV